MIFGLFGGDKKRVSEMIAAARHGETEKIKQLLSKGTDINAPEPESGDTALLAAIDKDQWATAEFLLTQHPNLSLQDKNGNSPLYLAVSKGDSALAMVNLLLEAGADADLGPSQGDNAGGTPLYIACATGANGCLESLLRHGASSTKRLPSGASPLHTATIGGNQKTIELLINGGGDVNALSNEKRTPLHNCGITGNVKAAAALIQAGAQVAGKDVEGCTPLMHAVMKNHAEMVKLLLDNGADPDSTVHTDSTVLYPLYVAAMYGFDEVIRILIDKGANVAFKVDGDHSPLDAAKHNGHEAAAKLIAAALKLQRAADKAAKGPVKEIAALWKKIVQAVPHKDVDTLRKISDSKHFIAMKPEAQLLVWVVIGEAKQAQALLDSGANPNETFDDVLDGISLLYAAAGLSRNLEVVKCLLNAGANPNLTWENGATPIFEAVTDEQLELLRLLISKGADANAKMSNGKTPLIMASANDSPSCVDLLLDAGANINYSMPENGLTAFGAAVDRLHMDLAMYLLKRGAKPDFGSAETLGLAVAEYGNLELIQAIEAKGGSIIRHDQLTRVAFVGSRNKDCEVFDHLLNQGANLSQDNDVRYTPLILAVLRNHPKLVQRYLERGDDPAIRDVDNETALSLAIENQREDMISMLRKFNAEVGDYAGLSDQEAMLKAAQNGNLGTILNLHDAGISLNIQDSQGNSPMVLATKAGHLGVVRSLYHLGADINHRNHAGLSATKIAAGMNDQNLRTTMMEFVADDAVPEGMEDIPLGGIHDLSNMLIGRLSHPGKENPPYDNDSADDEEFEDDETDVDENETPEEDAPVSSDIDEEETLEKLMQLESLLGEPHIASKFDDSMLARIAEDIEGVRTNGSSEYQPQIRGLLNLLKKLVELEEEEPLPPLFEAIAKSNLRSLKQLLKDGSEVNSTLPDGTSPLITAAQNGHVSIVTELLKQGADINHRRVDDVSAFLIACLAGHEDIVKLLVNSGADVNGTYTLNSENGAIGNNTALTVVAQRGRLSMCRLLVSLGANVNVVTDVGYTPLIAALANDCNEENARYLLKVGANPDPDAVSKLAFSPSTTPLVLAATNGLMGVVKDLIKLNVSLDKQDGDGRNALKQAAMSGHTNVVEALLKAGAAVDIADHEGWTALTNAAGSRNVPLVKTLLKAGANVNVTSESGETPLAQAVASQLRGGAVNSLLELKRTLGLGDESNEDDALDNSSAMEIVGLLLKHGANPNCWSEGVPLLEIAKEDEGLVKLLRKHGAVESTVGNTSSNTNDSGEDSIAISGVARTALSKQLMSAVTVGDVKKAKAFITKGADINFINSDGHTALTLVISALMVGTLPRRLKRAHQEIADFLIEKKADINTDAKGFNPLGLAAIVGNLHLVNALLRNGATTEFVLLGKGTPLLAAISKGREGCALALIDAGADIEVQSTNGLTVLHGAAKFNMVAVLEKVLSKRPTLVNSLDQETNTPLIVAAMGGHKDAVQTLLRFNASKGLRGMKGMTAADQAKTNNHSELIDLLS